MPVGTGSIKRAASKAGNTAKKPAAPKKGTTNAGTSRKTSAAKETSAKIVGAKSVKASTIASVSPEVVEKMQLGRKQFCHLTEELPVHLL